jgi:hypothetical protein
MRTEHKAAIVLATALVCGVGPTLSAQAHLADFSTTQSAEGPIARAVTLELAELERSAPEAGFSRDGRLITSTGRRAELPAAAARQRKRGIIGAVVGAAAGAVLGVGRALTYATRECGSRCADERAMIGVSLIGIPVAGGFAGYYIAK